MNANDTHNCVAIHQPNFFPWLGYFDKIMRSDVFVFLDNVQRPKTGGSWVNRVRLRMGGEAKWFTLPIDKSSHGLPTIHETRMVADDVVRRKLRDAVRFSYAKTPFFNEVYPVVSDLLASTESNLAGFNIAAVTELAARLGVPDSRFVRSSDLPYHGEVSTDRLVRIVKQVGGSCYLYGAVAAQSYQDNEKFEIAGIRPVAQEYRHPVYVQHGYQDFLPGLSIIDALMNCGFQGVRNLLSEGMADATEAAIGGCM